MVAQNYQPRPGAPELDIVASEGDTLVFVEVKSRRSPEYEAPDRAIDGFQREQLFRGGGDCVRRAGMDWSKVRFDVVSVLLLEQPEITHHRDVFPLKAAV